MPWAPSPAPENSRKTAKNLPRLPISSPVLINQHQKYWLSTGRIGALKTICIATKICSLMKTAPPSDATPHLITWPFVGPPLSLASNQSSSRLHIQYKILRELLMRYSSFYWTFKRPWSKVTQNKIAIKKQPKHKQDLRSAPLFFSEGL